MKDLQFIQDEYSNITGISFWICSPAHKCVTEKSLTLDFLGEDGNQLIDYVSLLIKESGLEQDVMHVSKNDIRLLVKVQTFLVEGKSFGYCVGVIYEDNSVSIDETGLAERVDFFKNMVEVLYRDYQEKETLKEELNKVKLAEKDAEKRNEILQHENDYDELTKVHSRAYFFKLLEEADKDESLLPISLVVGDVNNLKFTNDMFGHRHGDWLLCRIAQILQEEADKDNYTVARCGGDEFFIFMPKTKRAGANYYCKRVTDRLAEENSTCLPPSISLGSAKKSEMSQNLNRLLEVADAKMYAAKSLFKQKQDKFEEMNEVLISRGFLSREGIEKKAHLLAEFAASMDWTEQKIQNCVLLIRYQDIGLCIVPERIYKKEEYTEREWREIKKHPQLGMKIALISAETAPVSEWMYCTHENYDGTGWPRALKENAIAPEVTLVRLVTEFVDMEEKTDSRKAYEYVKEQSGKIFEPEMTGKFLKYIETQFL